MTDGKLTILSLGAGVQSSTLALMGMHDAIPYHIDAAIFADTRAEPAEVYRWLEFLEKTLPFPVHRVTRGDLFKDSLERRVSRKGVSYWKVGVPVFIRNADGGRGKLMRKCTAEYKIREILKCSRRLADKGVIRRWMNRHGVHRERVPVPEGHAWRWHVPEVARADPLVYSLIGISVDEIQRVKPSREPWIEHRHPLVDAGLSRAYCLKWMEHHGYPRPPRSACVFCPYHDDAEWAHMKREDPASFQAACEWEEAAAAAAACEITRGRPFLHSSLMPLPLVRFKEVKEATSSSGFSEECEGMCGV